MYDREERLVISSMVNDMNNLEIVNTKYDFKEIYDELVSIVKEKLSGRPIEFITSYNENIPSPLYGDNVHIKQILLNLLTNAINNTENGSITFNINYILRDDSVKLVVIVEDTGVGIKDEDIEKLFNENNSLTATKELLKLMDAKIAVQSKYNEGSKFTVYIEQKINMVNEPVVSTSTDIKENTITGNEPVNSTTVTTKYDNKKVLIVDDDPINLKVTTKLLEEYGISTETVNGGMECIDKILEGNKYDIIFMDQMMPTLSGEETLYNLNKIIGFNTPVVAISTSENDELKSKSLNLGFKSFLTLPINKQELDSLLKEIFGSSGEVSNVEENKELTGKELLEANGVDLDKSLELLGDMETYDETVTDFLNESETRLKNIEDYKAVADMPNYAILVHAMKSDSKYLGFMKLAELSYNHEMASKANDINYVNENYDELITEANRIIELVKKYLNK
jgi:CheY-like chemotaxis protein